MHNPPPKPAKTRTTPGPKKRKCDGFQSMEEGRRLAKSRRAVNKSHQQGVAPPSSLEALPSEIQCSIYQHLFHGIGGPVEAKPIAVIPFVELRNNGPLKASNVTSILRVSKKTNSEAAHAFYKTVVRPIDLWRSHLREAIHRATNPSSRRVTRAQDAANTELESILKHRHLTINVQLEFEEDRNCLKDFKKLLNVSRRHTVDLSINLGFINSHGLFDENGLVFKSSKENMKSIVSELLSWKAPRSTVKMRYTNGCICGNNRRFSTIRGALAHLAEETKNKNIPLTHTEGFPRDWPRWAPQPDRPIHFGFVRRNIVKRMDVNSV